MNYSRQREAILTSLANRYDHPTAETIYYEIKEEYPKISLGTVYRNLSLLAEIGEIQKITTDNGPDRFDFNVKPHMHFQCRQCGAFLDVDFPMEMAINEKLVKTFLGTIEKCQLQLYGLCPDCTNK